MRLDISDALQKESAQTEPPKLRKLPKTVSVSEHPNYGVKEGKVDQHHVSLHAPDQQPDPVPHQAAWEYIKVGTRTSM
jgi:hypothetical protein